MNNRTSFWVGIVVLLGLWLNPITPYNTLVHLDEGVKGAWAQVENQYQRRSDLIPNLVETVKGAADFESETLNEVVAARAKATQVTVDPSDPESLVAFQASQGQLSSALGRLLAVVENYPQLTATARFGDLQVQLEGTENRISTERRRFNEAVRGYNTYRRGFPARMWAALFGFELAVLFEAEEGAEKAPEVQF